MPETEFALPLRDVIAPTDPGWWPPAPGWWLLALIGLALLWLLWRWLGPKLKRLVTYEHAALKKQAAIELRQLAQPSGLSDQQWLSELSAVLKRVARQRFPERHIASLSGDKWLAFLAESSQQRAFSGPDSETDFEAQYAPVASLDRAACLRQSQRWVQSL